MIAHIIAVQLIYDSFFKKKVIPFKKVKNKGKIIKEVTEDIDCEIIKPKQIGIEKDK